MNKESYSDVKHCTCPKGKSDHSSFIPHRKYDESSNGDDENDNCVEKKYFRKNYVSNDDQPSDSGPYLDDQTLNTLSTLRQKACHFLKSESETSISCPSDLQRNYITPPAKNQSKKSDIMAHASGLIDYSPKSEFLKKMKQQCELLQNNQQNIFSVLNTKKSFSPPTSPKYVKKRNDLETSDPSYSDNVNCIGDVTKKKGKCPCCNCKHSDSDIDKDDCNELSEAVSGKMSEESSEIFDETIKTETRKAKHVSRSKKRHRCRKSRMNNSGTPGICDSQDQFEPSLKRPHENSCERCWRYASESRSPVNKPDQRYDPDFRRGHSCIDFTGELDNEYQDALRKNNSSSKIINAGGKLLECNIPPVTPTKSQTAPEMRPSSSKKSQRETFTTAPQRSEVVPSPYPSAPQRPPVSVGPYTTTPQRPVTPGPFPTTPQSSQALRGPYPATPYPFQTSVQPFSSTPQQPQVAQRPYPLTPYPYQTSPEQFSVTPQSTQMSRGLYSGIPCPPQTTPESYFAPPRQAQFPQEMYPGTPHLSQVARELFPPTPQVTQVSRGLYPQGAAYPSQFSVDQSQISRGIYPSSPQQPIQQNLYAAPSYQPPTPPPQLYVCTPQQTSPDLYLCRAQQPQVSPGILFCSPQPPQVSPEVYSNIPFQSQERREVYPATPYQSQPAQEISVIPKPQSSATLNKRLSQRNQLGQDTSRSLHISESAKKRKPLEYPSQVMRGLSSGTPQQTPVSRDRTTGAAHPSQEPSFAAPQQSLTLTEMQDGGKQRSVSPQKPSSAKKQTPVTSQRSPKQHSPSPQQPQKQRTETVKRRSDSRDEECQVSLKAPESASKHKSSKSPEQLRSSSKTNQSNVKTKEKFSQIPSAKKLVPCKPQTHSGVRELDSSQRVSRSDAKQKVRSKSASPDALCEDSKNASKDYLSSKYKEKGLRQGKSFDECITKKSPREVGRSYGAGKNYSTGNVYPEQLTPLRTEFTPLAASTPKKKKPAKKKKAPLKEFWQIDELDEITDSESKEKKLNKLQARIGNPLAHSTLKPKKISHVKTKKKSPSSPRKRKKSPTKPTSTQQLEAIIMKHLPLLNELTESLSVIEEEARSETPVNPTRSLSKGPNIEARPELYESSHPFNPCMCRMRAPEPEPPNPEDNIYCCHCDFGERVRPREPRTQLSRPVIDYSPDVPRSFTPLRGPPPSRDFWSRDEYLRNCDRNRSMRNYEYQPDDYYSNECNPYQYNRKPRAPPPISFVECPYLQQRCGRVPLRSQNPIGSNFERKGVPCPQHPNYFPTKYSVFYMTENRDNDKDVEVLVEELTQSCKNKKDTKTSDVAEKLKKISACPSDSMALRFQKGVSQSCKPPNSSRILYF